MAYRINKTGPEVEAAINKIIALGPATTSEDGNMSAEDKIKLDSIGIHYNTTHYWDCQIGYIPKAGEIIIYSDYQVVEIDGHTQYIPGIKVGSGNGYVQDLAFLGNSDTELLAQHISDNLRHINEGERNFWNNKININDASEVVNETLIFNRN
jgi:hypothetical protein